MLVNMSRNQEIGKFGEGLAVKYLQKRKYIILDRNYRCKQGEMDIIAKDDEEIVFIEVKTRTTVEFGKPAEAVNYVKREHLQNIARYYLYTKKITKIPIRFDVIEIYLWQKEYSVNHIEQII